MDGKAGEIYGQPYKVDNFCSNEECIPVSEGIDVKCEYEDVKCEDDRQPSSSQKLAPIVFINVDECQIKDEDSQDISYSLGPLQDPLAFHEIDIWDKGTEEFGAISGIGRLEGDPGRNQSVNDGILSAFYNLEKITLKDFDRKALPCTGNLHKIGKSCFEPVKLIDDRAHDFRHRPIKKYDGAKGNRRIISEDLPKSVSAAYEPVLIATGQVDDNLLKSDRLSKASGNLKSSKCKRKRAFACLRAKRKKYTFEKLAAAVISPRDYSILSDRSICINIPEDLDDIIMRYSTEDGAVSRGDIASQSQGKLYNFRKGTERPYLSVPV